METVQAIEPSVSTSYLNSYPDFVPVILPIVKNLPGAIMATEVNSQTLAFTPYKVACHGKRLYVGSEVVTEFHIDVVNRDGTEITSGHNGVALDYYEERGTVQGHIDNDTHRHTPLKVGSQPIRNLSGVVGPIEDAFCQVVANESKRTITRLVKTYQKKDSRLVQNYMKRGYRITNEEIVDDSDAPAGIWLEKEFLKQETITT